MSRRMLRRGHIWAMLLGVFMVSCCPKNCDEDRTPPVISNVDVTRNPETGVLEIEANVVDDSGELALVVVESPDLQQPVAMQPAPGVFLYRVELPRETGRIRIKAMDKAGNQTVSEYALVPPPNPPSL